MALLVTEPFTGTDGTDWHTNNATFWNGANSGIGSIVIY